MYLPPGDMPERIGTATALRNPEPEVVVRCILDSLATAFAAGA